jgi:hypothetical protein
LSHLVNSKGFATHGGPPSKIFEPTFDWCQLCKRGAGHITNKASHNMASQWTANPWLAFDEAVFDADPGNTMTRVPMLTRL